jgi:hypothetical protein
MQENGLDALIVFLCLSLHWTFDESLKFVRQTPIKKLNAFVEELQCQKAVEDYRQAANFASIVCTMASSKQRKYKVTDIIGPPPSRKADPGELRQAADKAGIKLEA